MSASTTNLPPLEPPAAPTSAWKDEVSARLRAHRSGRSRVPENQPTLPGLEAALEPSAIAARVAERYARVPSYRDMLAAKAAAEARAAAEAAAKAQAEARAKAEAARRAAAEAAAAAARAEAPAAVQEAAHEPDAVQESAAAPERPVLDRLTPDRPTPDRLTPDRPAPGTSIPPRRSVRGAALDLSAPAEAPRAPEPQAYQPDLIRYSVSSDSLPAPRTAPAQARAAAVPHTTAVPVLETAPDPMEEAIVEPTRLLPARIIEFPRELIAPRKARPRIAEGPLREDAAQSAPAAEPPRSVDTAFFESLLTPAAQPAELRILEAEAETETAPSAVEPDAPAAWRSIHLDADEAAAEPEAATRSSLLEDMPLHVAPLEDRLMAGIVDLAFTLAAFLLFVLVFAACTTHLPMGKVAAAGSCMALLAIFLLYQFVFFTMTGATLGMRYAKIALCTFEDENPTRAAVRMRIPALLLSALPLGLGFLWAAFDEDYLGWHDRITQTYQRSYREM